MVAIGGGFSAADDALLSITRDSGGPNSWGVRANNPGAVAQQMDVFVICATP
jgi:hypothetical protein